MFDEQVSGANVAATLSLVSTTHRLVRQQECKLLELAAHWADLHHPDNQAPAEKTLPGAEQGRQLGGDGTPDVLEFCVAELGTSTETSYGSARALMADALDLRHRLPELWQLIMAGSVQAWKARKVAQATRYLSRSSAMHVDAAVAPSIAGLPWARFDTLLAAKIIEADPRAAEEQAKIWEAERFVRAGRTNQNGLKLLIAKANAGDVTWFMATVNRIAEILRLQGDMESADVRRSKAIGILAQPALALQLLWDFRNEQRPAGKPQQLEDPIHDDSKAPFDDVTAPPSEDLLDSEPGETFEAEPSAAQRSEQDPEASTGRASTPSRSSPSGRRRRPARHWLRRRLDHPALRGRSSQTAPAGYAAHPSQRGSAAQLPQRQTRYRRRSVPLERRGTYHPRPNPPLPARHRLRCDSPAGHRSAKHTSR
jgi:hypothetical protein